MIRLSSQDKPFFPGDYTEKLSMVRELGFDGFEADGRMLLNDFDQLAGAVKTTGVPVTSICGGYRGWIGDFDADRRAAAIEDISDILRRAEALGASGIVVPAAWGMYSLRLPPLTRKRPQEEDEAVLLDSLSRLERVCDETGRKVFLEPLNRYEDYMLNLLSDAAALIDKGGFRHVKITADFYHMNIEENSIPESLVRFASYLGHIHIGDSQRYQPGSGHLDFVSGFRALGQVGFSGVFAFEHRVLGEDQAQRYREGVLYIRDCMRKAGL